MVIETQNIIPFTITQKNEILTDMSNKTHTEVVCQKFQMLMKERKNMIWDMCHMDINFNTSHDKNENWLKDLSNSYQNINKSFYGYKQEYSKIYMEIQKE